MNQPVRLEVVHAARGLAALLVVLYHVTTISKSYAGQAFFGGVFDPLGFYGIDFFFVLSGFIITYAYWRDIGRPTRVWGFLTRRFVRIFPLYWALTLAIGVLYAAIPTLGDGRERQPEFLLRSLLLLTGDDYPVIAVGWTLQYEVLFYAVFGLLMVVPPRAASAVMIVWMASCAAAALSPLVGQSILPTDAPGIARFVLYRRNLEFGLGWGAALAFSREYVPPPIAAGMAVGGALAFCGFGIAESLNLLKIDPVVAYGLPAAVLVFGAATIERTSTLRLPRALAALGDSSYSTYLIHYSAVAAMATLVVLSSGATTLRGPVASVALVAGALASGWITYRLLERPLLVASRRALGVPGG